MDVSISKTAVDALYAKLSFCSMGYIPTASQHDSPTTSNVYINETDPATLYITLLQLMVQALQQNDDAEDTHNTDIINRPPRIKRQTPLINAGYATRVAIITRTIQRFITQQRSSLNIVLLGCGFDVLGLWVHSLCQSQNVYTYEVDAYDNATKKCQALKYLSHSLPMKIVQQQQRQDWEITEVIDKGRSTSNILFQGYISTRRESSFQPTLDSQPINYTLFHSDLRDVTSLQQGFQETGMDVSLPTIVISELVLAYLGTQERIDELLPFISQKICVCPDSMILLYEPMGPVPLNSSPSPIVSVQDGYAATYFQHFSDKLDRNSSSGRRVEQNLVPSSRFQCIGPNPTFICNRLRAYGFDGPVDCCCAGSAAAALNWKLISQDVFDEYTALFMHLSCYAVISACSSSQMNMATFRRICPWSKPQNALKGSGFQNVQKFTFKSKSTISPEYPEFSITLISAQDEAQVRIQFENTYTDLFDTYPSVKKMVKNALKTDLSISRSDSPETIMYSKNLVPRCQISDYYQNLNGAFWVAALNIPLTDHSILGETEKPENERRIIGFIGIRSAGSVKTDEIKAGIQRYEIMRLAVCADWRNMGVGTALISTARNFIRERQAPGVSESAILMATTPAISDEANKLYTSLGFDLVHEITQSGLLMKTYYGAANSML